MLERPGAHPGRIDEPIDLALLEADHSADASAALANDLAVEALSSKEFYESPEGAPRIVIDADFVRQQSDSGALTSRIRSLLDSHYRGVVATAEVHDGCVTVTVSASGNYVFAGLVPGARRAFHLAASAGATPRRDRGASAC